MALTYLYTKIMAYIPDNKNWFQRVAEGEVEGYSCIEKFGENPGIDTTTTPEDIWDAGGVYTYSTSADITKLASSSGSDTVDILITGLDENWLEVNQTITLTGQTVATLTTPLIRVYRMINVGTSDLVGVVYCAVTGATYVSGVPDTATDIRAQIVNGNNQTLMTQYTVPAGKTGYFYSSYVTMSKSGNKSAVVDYLSRPFGLVFQNKGIVALIGAGKSSWDYRLVVPTVLPEKTDVVLRVKDVDANDTGVSAGYTVLLKDN